MTLSPKSGAIGLSRWAIHCPGYFLVRLLAGNGSDAEISYHRRHRVQSIASAVGIPVTAVESSLREVELNDRIQSLELRVSQLPYSGIFRGGPELYAIIRALKPAQIVETGVGTGYSTSYILEALDLNGFGHLTSIDLPNEDTNWRLPEGQEPGFLVPGQLRDRWSLMLGRTKEVLPRVLNQVGRLDAFFHDSEHTYDVMKFEYSQAAMHLTEGGLLISDDAMWNTAFLDFAKGEKLSIRFIYHQGRSAPFTLVRMTRSHRASRSP